MSEMTREHLDAVQWGVAALNDATTRERKLAQYDAMRGRQGSAADASARASFYAQYAARLSEVAAMIEAKLENRDEQ
jgi:hypothetical protein